MRRILIPLILAGLVAGCESNAQNEVSEYHQGLHALMQAQLDAGVPGLSVYAKVGDDVWMGTVGEAHLESDVPVTEATAFRLASLTKSFTAAVIYELIEDGKLTLDTVVSDVLPQEMIAGLPDMDRTTIEHLLNHQTGLTNFTNVDAYNAFRWTVQENRSQLIEPLELIDLVRGLDATAEPGERYEYNNTGYFLLGLIAEAVEDRPLHQIYRSRIFDPLGLPHTYMSGYEKPLGVVADSYAGEATYGHQHGIFSEATPRTDETGVTLFNMSAEAPNTYNAWAYSAGAIDSTAADVARFYGAILDRDYTIWNSEDQDVILADPRGIDYNGGSWGIATTAYINGPHDIVLVILANGQPADWNRNDMISDFIDLLVAEASSDDHALDNQEPEVE